MEAIETKAPQGKTHRFKVPSGDYITIREQNGNDDDIISNSGKSKDGTSFNEFISGIIINSERAGGRLSPSDILDMPLRDKYTVLIQSRIFSLGETVSFQYDFGNGIQKDLIDFSEDLNRYTWDYDTDFPAEGHPDYEEERIPPYEGTETYFELELSSGKIVRLDFLNGKSEKYILSIEEDNQSANMILKARNIRLKQPELTYMKVETFTIFSARDMLEIRSGVKRFDLEITLNSEIEHPKNGMSEILSLTQIPDFFFPVLS